MMDSYEYAMSLDGAAIIRELRDMGVAEWLIEGVMASNSLEIGRGLYLFVIAEATHA